MDINLMISASTFGFVVAATLALLLVVKYLHIKEDNYLPATSDGAILITGCDSGIGLELAKNFCNYTKLKIVCGFLHPNSSEGFKILKELSESNSEKQLILKPLDLTSNGDIERLVHDIQSLKHEGLFKNLVGVINNAGVLTYGEFDWLTWDQIESQISVNLIGTVRLTRALMPLILESKGRIVNISSVNDLTVFPGSSIYSATKSAISTFSRGLGYEMRKFGVRVITVRLGDFCTLTKILSMHKSNIENMWNEMSPRKRNIYRDYFYAFNKHVMDNFGIGSPRDFGNSSLYKDLKTALLSRSPPHVITCAPIHYRWFYATVEVIPVWMQYHLLDVLLQVGFRWKAPPMITDL